MRGSELVFDSIDLLHYDLHKISLNKGRSKNKRASINPKDNDDTCFQYAVTAALSHEQIKKNPQRISKTKGFIDQYNWQEIDFPSHKKDWKQVESNNKSIALNVLYAPYTTEKIRHAYKSKYNKERENQVILLMITDGKKWHYFATKKLSALSRGVTSKHDGDFSCLNCFHSFTTKNKLEKYYYVCRNHGYYYVEMPKEYNKIWKYNHGEKSVKIPFIIYADFESLLEKMSTCHNNPEKSSIIKINKHEPSGYSWFTHCSFDLKKVSLIVIEVKTIWKGFVRIWKSMQQK